MPTAIAVLLFSYLVEILQYFNIIEILGLQHLRWARIIIGTSFAWQDLAAYTAGTGLVILFEQSLGYYDTAQEVNYAFRSINKCLVCFSY